MGIQELSIKGFRSLRDVTWRPGTLNVVIGPNASGKSNLLRAIGLLRGAAMGALSQDVLGMGGIAPLLWDGRTQELAWTARVEPFLYELRLHQLGAGSRYRVEKEWLTREASMPPALLERAVGRAAIEGRELDSSEARLPDEQTLLSLGASPLLSSKVAEFRDLLSSWTLYHDIRVDPTAPMRQASVARMEQRVAADGQNLVPVLHTLYTGSRDFKRLVDDAMRVAFGPDYDELVFPPAADQRVQLRVRWRTLRTEQSAADLSDGTLRFLLLLAILANPDPPDLIAFDEPETGLHPSMLPIVAEHAVEAARRTQVIFTTHSAQLLDAFTSTPPTTTVAEWEAGETRLSVIDGDELARWLQEYGLGALFRSGELEGMA